ncbi:MAG: roadblock/LC7 domain-containing protein [Candidatus Sumerlaeia bacterium]
MESILMELNKTPGITGSFVVSPDGMIIASDYTSELDDERLGAIISTIISATEKAMAKMETGLLSGFIVETDKTKMFFHKFSLGYLVTIAGAEANLGLVRVESRSAVNKIEASARSGV